MSRHRDVRNLDYDELLEDESGNGEMTPAESDRLDQAVDAITQRIGSEFSLQEVKDAAWYYYFDVDQSSQYLLEQRTRQSEKENKRRSASAKGMPPPDSEDSFASASRPKEPPSDLSKNSDVSSMSVSTMGLSRLPPTKEKKLSKLQQLAQAKAAAKKAAILASDISTQPRTLASTLEKLKVPKAPTPTEKCVSGQDSVKISIISAPTAKSCAAQVVSSNNDPIAFELHGTDLSSVSVAAPSNFAKIVLGALGDSGSSSKNTADRVFSCFTVNTGKSITSAQLSFAEPSPDDVVQKAQASSKGLVKGKTQNAPVLKDSANGATVPSPTKHSNKPRRGRPVKSSIRGDRSLVVVGHVDAGKSTLFGRLLYDLGNIDERSMQKLRKESEKMQKASFAFAWAMDSSTEERERGVTIDVATNSFTADQTTFTILDAPGHKDFVPNMIAGASQADFAILVIDSSRGAFESGFDAAGQTKEHAILIRALGIQQVIVAVNKLDNAGWSFERFKDIKVQMLTFLKHTGFEENSLHFVPCSGLTGENVATDLQRDLAPWFSGRSVLNEMKSIEVQSRDEKGPFRMLVADIQATPNSNNLTVVGRVSSGELQVDDSILCMPSKESAVVKALLAGDNTETAYAGDNVVITLANLDPIYLRIGDVLCHPTEPVENVVLFKARVVTFQMLRPLLTGSSVVLHRGRADLPAVVKKIEVMDKVKDCLKIARHISSGTQAVLTIELVRGIIPLETFVANKDLGRVILRREGDTVAAGVVSEILKT